MYFKIYRTDSDTAEKCVYVTLEAQVLINNDNDNENTTLISQHNVHIYAGRVLYFEMQVLKASE